MTSKDHFDASYVVIRQIMMLLLVFVDSVERVILLFSGLINYYGKIKKPYIAKAVKTRPDINRTIRFLRVIFEIWIETLLWRLFFAIRQKCLKT